MTTTGETLHCSCCEREYPRRKLHALREGGAYVCRRCGLWIALRLRSDQAHVHE